MKKSLQHSRRKCKKGIKEKDEKEIGKMEEEEKIGKGVEKVEKKKNVRLYVREFRVRIMNMGYMI
jgi:uncharacterized protein (DUF2344 family)